MNNTGTDKYGQDSGVTISIPTNNKEEIAKDVELSKEEKLRKRQEKIRQWKLKKEQEEQQEEEEKKKLLRQQKLEEWKRKKENLNAPKATLEQQTQAPKKNVLAFGATKSANGPKQGILKIKPSLPTKNVKAIKRSVFNNDENEEEGRKRKKIPTFASMETENEGVARNPPKIQAEGSDGEDEIDLFLQDLEMSKKKKANGLEPVSTDDKQVPGEVALDGVVDDEDDDDMEDEIDHDEIENQRINSRIEKLQQKEKVLKVIDHNKVQYNEFRKVFYHEPSELARLTEEEVDTIRLLMDGIKVRGLECPKPVLKWSQLGLPVTIMDIIENKLQFDAPSSIQSQALPAILSGRDVIGVAKTGSGKTLSFVLPMIRHIQGQDPLRDGDGPIALIMSPTRELSLQIYKEITNFTKKVGLNVSCCYGGAPIQNQIADLKRGVEIIVGTPGRIIDLLAANAGRVTNLNRVTYLVLDEADRMFDMGFEPQVMRVFGQVRPTRQTVLFSATFPRMMESLAKNILQNPIEIVVGGRSIVAPEIKQEVELFDSEDADDEAAQKFNKLVEILNGFTKKDENGKILIFVEKQTMADELLVKLLKQNYACLAIHGGKDQIDRKYSIKEFASMKSGINILIATSIAARGLDVKGLNLVINYDSPNHMEDYVHRVGRTGRAGMSGTAITFVAAKQDRLINDLVKAMRLSKIPDSAIPPKLIEISSKFLSKVKSGKEKFSFGFGGKGLDKLQEIRESKYDQEKKQYNSEDATGTPSEGKKKENGTNSTSAKTGANLSGGVKPSSTKIDFPDFEIIEGRAPETAGPDKGKFHARIAVNDLPQTARWNVVSRENISKIIETTNTSITNKGQFYPPGSKVPKPTVKHGKEIPAPPKLYLLVEGLTESSVKEAIKLLRLNMVEGLETAVQEESRGPNTKYKV